MKTPHDDTPANDGTKEKPVVPYRDPSVPMATRVEDLLARMTLVEKAGLMFHTMIVVGPDGALSDGEPGLGIDDTKHMIHDLRMNHFNLVGAAADIRTMAQWYNRLQEESQATRLAIPITLSTDPRNHFTENPLASALSGPFSQWPETLGLAALRSPELVRRFADIARQEYIAVGLRVALHPQIDLATEPRWGRISATFGEDADVSSVLAAAYIRGFQGDTLGPDSVSTVSKHFPGGGPQKNGDDPHFAYGREQVYPGDQFRYHLKPFQAAIAAGGSQMMPYYGVPMDTEYEEVAFGYNKGVITGLLREELGFQGIVCTDWAIVTDGVLLGEDMPARAWGVEHLDALSRVEKIINAGCDQVGGEDCPELVVKLVQDGRISEGRIDLSVRRILREKFTLGLFDNPFVDPDRAEAIVGNTAFAAEGATAQRRAYTLLTNTDATLPLKPGISVYLENIDPTIASRYASVVTDPALASVALVRLKAPFEERDDFFESLFHSGSLEYSEQEQTRQSDLYRSVPTVVDIYLERPAVIPKVAAEAAALLGSYGSSDEAFLDVVFGYAEPEGVLPFDLPSSMAAVIAAREDVPFDTADPLFSFGHGLRYAPRPAHAVPVHHSIRSEQAREVSQSTPSTPLIDAPKAHPPADLEGIWQLTVQTPRGEQQATLLLIKDADRLTGRLNDTEITDGRYEDNNISFRAELTSPFKLRISCKAVITGDELIGTATASMIPAPISLNGIRDTERLT